MNITLHIDRLILEGIDLPRHQRPMLQAAVEAELVRLIAEGGISPALLGGGAVPRIPGGALTLTSGADPAGLGLEIAGAVYGGLQR